MYITHRYLSTYTNIHNIYILYHYYIHAELYIMTTDQIQKLPYLTVFPVSDLPSDSFRCGVGLRACETVWPPEKRHPINLAHVEPGRPSWLGDFFWKYKGVDHPQTPSQKLQSSKCWGFCRSQLGIRCWPAGILIDIGDASSQARPALEVQID